MVAIYEHVRRDQHLLAPVTIAFLIGLSVNLRPMDAKPRDDRDWAYRHPLATQALVGAGLAVMALIVIFNRH
jgi:hypothetical protein